MLLAGAKPLDGGGQRGEPYVAQAAKDHELIVRLMSLFAKLRDMSDDEPARIEELSRSDESFRKLLPRSLACLWAA
jgi:hypothetical protein